MLHVLRVPGPWIAGDDSHGMDGDVLKLNSHTPRADTSNVPFSAWPLHLVSEVTVSGGVNLGAEDEGGGGGGGE